MSEQDQNPYAPPIDAIERPKKRRALHSDVATTGQRVAGAFLIGEEIPGTMLPVDAYADAVVEGAKKSQKGVAVLERHALPGHLDDGVFLHTTSSMNGLSLESYYAVIAEGAHLDQIITFAQRSAFAPLAPDLRSMIASFQGPPHALTTS